eukprot:scaffold80056_cov30-Tisochrysis_lutea.AAC.3
MSTTHAGVVAPSAMARATVEGRPSRRCAVIGRGSSREKLVVAGGAPASSALARRSSILHRKTTSSTSGGVAMDNVAGTLRAFPWSNESASSLKVDTACESIIRDVGAFSIAKVHVPQPDRCISR